MLALVMPAAAGGGGADGDIRGAWRYRNWRKGKSFAMMPPRSRIALSIIGFFLIGMLTLARWTV